MQNLWAELGNLAGRDLADSTWITKRLLITRIFFWRESESPTSNVQLPRHLRTRHRSWPSPYVCQPSGSPPRASASSSLTSPRRGRPPRPPRILGGAASWHPCDNSIQSHDGMYISGMYRSRDHALMLLIVLFDLMIVSFRNSWCSCYKSRGKDVNGRAAGAHLRCKILAVINANIPLQGL